MNKLFKLKDWLSLNDTATRLSTSFGENVTTRDVIELCIKNELPICMYYPSKVPAEYVVHFWQRLTPWHIDVDVAWEPACVNASLDDRNLPSTYLQGFDYRIDLDLSEKALDYLHCLAVDAEPANLLDDLILIDSDGHLVRPVIRHLHENQDVYVPGGYIDSTAKLVIRRIDIETFEAEHLHQAEQPTNTSTQELHRTKENNYLRAIHTLSDLATKGLTGVKHKDANAVEAALASGGHKPLPVKAARFADWLEEAAQLD